MKNNWSVKKDFKKIWLQICISAYWIIFLTLITFSIIFLLLSFYANPPANLSDLLINLSAGYISALFTVFFIDFLRKANKEAKWHDSKSIADDELLDLTNMFISYMTIPFGYKVTDYDIDHSNMKKDSEKVLSNILEEVLKKDLEKMLRKLSFEKWEHLELNLLFLKPSISEYLEIYDEVFSHKQRVKLLKTRRAFNKFYKSFALVNIGWIKDKKSPPNVLLNSLAEELRYYFDSVLSLVKIVYEK